MGISVNTVPENSSVTDAATSLSLESATPLTRTNATIEDLILENPVKYFEIFRKRLKKDGPNASFPEFAPVVNHLLEYLNSEEFEAKIKPFAGLELELTEVKTFLAHVNLDFTFDDAKNYPYALPFKGPYPYRPTIDAIESAIRLNDKIDRLSPNSKAQPLYHFDRYAYHRHSLLANEDVIIFPTLRDLSFEDLIRVRSVPLGFVGVLDQGLRADRHYQSPLDFWYHDLNHIRRMTAYIAKRVAEQKLMTPKAKREFYQAMDDFITTKIIPNIAPLPPGADPVQVAIRRIARVMIFEVLHETALTAERDAILHDLKRGPGPQPFEHMVPREEFDANNVENLRTATGNIESGSSIQKATGDNRPITIRYFHDRALGLLANIYNKLNYGFYDDPNDPNEFVAPVEARRADYVIAAAKVVFRDILDQTDIPSDEELKELILSMEGSPEKFVYKRINDHEGVEYQGPNVSEPMSAAEVIAEFEKIKASGMRVYTLFGYSLLDYEDKRKVMGKIRHDLENLDPKEWVINIGATEDGIGAAYHIAKTLGFRTTGIVSTQALTYSGKFSPAVDDIFIVNDKRWGGRDPKTQELAATTQAFIEVSDVIAAYGGGQNTAVTLEEAIKRRKDVRYAAAEMNHTIAQSQTNSDDLNYRGAAYDTWIKLHTA